MVSRTLASWPSQRCAHYSTRSEPNPNLNPVGNASIILELATAFLAAAWSCVIYGVRPCLQTCAVQCCTSLPSAAPPRVECQSNGGAGCGGHLARSTVRRLDLWCRHLPRARGVELRVVIDAETTQIADSGMHSDARLTSLFVTRDDMDVDQCVTAHTAQDHAERSPPRPGHGVQPPCTHRKRSRALGDSRE